MPDDYHLERLAKARVIARCAWEHGLRPAEIEQWPGRGRTDPLAGEWRRLVKTALKNPKRSASPGTREMVLAFLREYEELENPAAGRPWPARTWQDDPKALRELAMRDVDGPAPPPDRVEVEPLHIDSTLSVEDTVAVVMAARELAVPRPEPVPLDGQADGPERCVSSLPGGRCTTPHLNVRLFPHGWFCSTCRPLEDSPRPDPALTLEGLRQSGRDAWGDFAERQKRYGMQGAITEKALGLGGREVGLMSKSTRTKRGRNLSYSDQLAQQRQGDQP